MRVRQPVGRRASRIAPALAILAAALWAAPAANAAVCQTSSPASAAYSVTVCLQSPAPAATLTGTIPVTATVSTTGTSPGVKKVAFSLGAAYVLTDFEAPYSFSLPGAKWVDGLYSLQATATMRDGFSARQTSESVTLTNGVTTPPVNTGAFSASRGTVPASGQPFTLVAAGDGAAGDSASTAVTNLIGSWSPNMFLYLGDVYEKGSPAEFYNWYDGAGSLFGRFKSITNPTIGNHEYMNGSAAGYLDYWNNVPHYYSFNAGGWHVVSLDSNTELNQLSAGTPQFEWLKQDLTANQSACNLVYFHHPYLDVTNAGDDARLAELWTLLAQKGVDVVLNGHAHNYQHWRPVGAGGALNASGPTELVVGTAGHSGERFLRSDARLAAGVDSPGSSGALRMQMSATGATYQFVTTAGTTLDSGSVSCGPPPPTAKPFFNDGFESGSMSAWTSSTGLAVQSAQRYSGAYAARATSTGGATFARKQLAGSYTNIYYRVRFNVLDKPATNVYLAKLRDTADSSVLGLSVNETGQLALTNYFTGSKYSGPSVAPGWHEAQVHAVVAGGSSQTEVWLDGVKAPALNKVESLGSTPIDKLQLGDQSTGRSYDLVFDEVTASAGPIASAAPAPAPSPSPSATPAPSASPAPAPPLFQDGFETGTLTGWVAPIGLSVQTAERYSGVYGVRATSAGTPTFAKAQLGSAYTSLYARARFKVVSKSNYVYLLKVRDSADASVLGLYVADGGQLAYTNYVTGSKWTSATVVPSGWHTVQVHAALGAAQTEVWLDGVKLADLSRTETLGAVPMDKLQLGDNSTGKVYDVAFDDVVIDVKPIP